jgi:hypothetical protein
MLIIEFYDEIYLFGSINPQLSNIVDDHNLLMMLCRDLMVRPYRYIFSIVRCPRRGTMRLHILRGMKAEVILAYADICTHEVYIYEV